MPTPSLLIVPARFKSGKLYSQIPTSGDGDFTVTRNTTATRFNSAGLIESVASGIPRLDYYTSGGVTGCPALLVEPAATNLALQSEGFSVSGTWVPEGINPTQVTANSTGTLDPAGGNTADIITLVSGSTNQLRQSFISTSGTIYTASIFLKNIALTSGQTFLFSTTNQEATINQVNCTIDLANLTITAATQGAGVTVSNAALDNYGNGWYRARFTFSFAVGGTNSFFRLRQPNIVGTNYAFYAWGAQLETGSVATTYIPTTTGTGSRSADVISVSGAVSGSIGQTEGTIYLEMQADAAGAGNCHLLVAGLGSPLASNYLYIGKSSGVMRVRVRIGAASDVINNGATVLDGSVLKVALAYQQSGNCTAYVNGNFLVSASTVNNFSEALTGVGFGSDISFPITSNTAINRIRAVALYTTRLSNAELATLTTP